MRYQIDKHPSCYHNNIPAYHGYSQPLRQPAVHGKYYKRCDKKELISQRVKKGSEGCLLIGKPCNKPVKGICQCSNNKHIKRIIISFIYDCYYKKRDYYYSCYCKRIRKIQNSHINPTSVSVFSVSYQSQSFNCLLSLLTDTCLWNIKRYGLKLQFQSEFIITPIPILSIVFI